MRVADVSAKMYNPLYVRFGHVKICFLCDVSCFLCGVCFLCGLCMRLCVRLALYAFMRASHFVCVYVCVSLCMRLCVRLTTYLSGVGFA